VLRRPISTLRIREPFGKVPFRVASIIHQKRTRIQNRAKEILDDLFVLDTHPVYAEHSYDTFSTTGDIYAYQRDDPALTERFVVICDGMNLWIEDNPYSFKVHMAGLDPRGKWEKLYPQINNLTELGKQLERREKRRVELSDYPFDTDRRME